MLINWNKFGDGNDYDFATTNIEIHYLGDFIDEMQRAKIKSFLLIEDLEHQPKSLISAINELELAGYSVTGYIFEKNDCNGENWHSPALLFSK